jgi:hypothetical protein
MVTRRETLHHLVDGLDPEQLPAAERLLESLQRKDKAVGVMAETAAQRPEFGHHPTIEELAAEQGVGPITSIDSLRADFWPEDEDPDAFVDAIRRWRRENPGQDAA